MFMYKKQSSTSIVNFILEAIEERCKTDDEIESTACAICDVLYELIDYDLYKNICEEVQKQVDEKFDVFII